MRMHLLFGTAAATAVSCSGVAVSGGALQSIPPMDVARAAHTMTPLPDGRVLVVGGFGRDDELAESALIFDPADMRFLVIDGDGAPRHSHTATVLADGTVLIVGGYGRGAAYLKSAAVFDPESRTFRRVGDLRVGRAGHTATLLLDGTVLVLGGVGDGWTFLESAEIYDPAAGRFAAAGSMSIARESHTAVRLNDGRVLVAGGHGGTRQNLRILDSAEIYDPAASQFVTTGAMSVRRHKHDAVMLDDGRVLVLGGADERDSQGVYQSTELFDPGVGTFLPHVEMVLGRYKLAGSTLRLEDGRFLVSGGAVRPEVYEPLRRRFGAIPTPETLPGLFSATARLADGRVIITGGYGDSEAVTARAWLFESP